MCIFWLCINLMESQRVYRILITINWVLLQFCNSLQSFYVNLIFSKDCKKKLLCRYKYLQSGFTSLSCNSFLSFDFLGLMLDLWIGMFVVFSSCNLAFLCYLLGKLQLTYLIVLTNYKFLLISYFITRLYFFGIRGSQIRKSLSL